MNSEACPGERYCSIVARLVGEDPIGSAWAFGFALIVEIPTPWSRLLADSPGFPADVRAMLEGRKVPVLALAPDPEYSLPGLTRVIWMESDPDHLGFRRTEYLVPGEALCGLAEALLDSSDRLSEYELYRVPDTGMIDLMVCTHGSVDVCCAKFGYPIYHELRTRSSGSHNIRVWRVSHFGGHRFAPTLLELPSGRFWGFLDPQHLGVLLRKEGSVRDLFGCYRGWAALGSGPEQVAERELFMAHGWAWDSYRKRCQVLRESDGVSAVRIAWEDPASGQSQVRRVTVEVAATLTTLGHTGGPPLEVKQYRVTEVLSEP